MRSRILVLAVVSLLVVLALGPLPASADIQGFMKFPGLPGESTNDRHKDEIELVSYSQLAGENRCVKAIVVKNLDRASPGLAVLAVTNQVVTPVIISLSRVSDTPADVFTAVLENVTVGTVELVEVDGTPVPTERVTLKPRRATLTYTQQRADGGPGTPVTTTIICPF